MTGATQKGVNPVPADPVMVAEYLAYRSESVSAATVRMALTAIKCLTRSGRSYHTWHTSSCENSHAGYCP
ncbi:MAG: hypothetical protein OXC62_00950 [Aestuariivita sp.]|nr:hypothetical protein [Aestuariivita sp.]